MKKSMLIFVAISFVTFLLSNCSNSPKGLYEFVDKDGSVKSLNLIDDSTAIMQESKTRLSLTVKYIIKEKFLILKNIPYYGDIPFEITKDGIKNAGGELFVKKSSSSVPSIKSKESSENMLTPDELVAQNKFIQILNNNSFIKANGLTSFLSLSIKSNKNYEFNVFALSGFEPIQVVNVRGTYQITLSNNLDEAELTLYPDKVQKSQAYNTFEDIDIDYFINSNTKFTIRKFENLDVQKYVSENPLQAQGAADKNELPEYVLDGNIVFYSRRIKTQAENDSIAAEERKVEKKKNDLESKLEGL